MKRSLSIESRTRKVRFWFSLESQFRKFGSNGYFNLERNNFSVVRYLRDFLNNVLLPVTASEVLAWWGTNSFPPHCQIELEPYFWPTMSRIYRTT
jgi:hypothetical protein